MVDHRMPSFGDRTCLVALFVAAAVATPVFSQQPAPSNSTAPRRGGLLPQRSDAGGGAPISREELIRKFDRDGNGRIDEMEAELARSRMRRERTDTRPQSIIDPLTGRLRGASPPTQPAPGGKTAREADRDDGEEVLLVPGRPEEDRSAGAKTETTAKTVTERPKPRDLNAAYRNPASGERIAPKTLRPPVVTGGVRAGGLPVRPGYGSGLPRTDLNAGRRPGVPPAAAPTVPGSGPAAPQRPSLFPQSGPRVSAEDFGP